MRRIGLFLFIMIVSAACHLSPTPLEGEPTYTPRPETPPPFTIVPAAQPTTLPTFLPLAPPPVTNIPVTSAPPLGATCQVYTTYSGTVAANKLSLRSAPSVAAPQVFRVPNNTPVFLVPGSQEVEGDGYHWLNVIYVDVTQTRYVGWMARDSYSKGGVRDPSIATLQQTGAQAAC
jgi:hypothetical protein